MKEKQYFTIPQLAEILGLSRIAIYKKVKRGEIKAVKIGRNYAIPEARISEILGKNVSKRTKRIIEEAVRKTVEDYGEVLRMLGND
ncbi:MAG: helix-turn-helix domain-containing protein [Clostridiales bacterium]|nr:helix-turn-helix domain-containing protein [Clostridiales bacterium]